MARKFEQTSADFKKLEKVGDKAEGTIVSIIEKAPVKDKFRPVVVLKTDEGSIDKVALTESAWPDLSIYGPGEYVRVTLKELVPTGKGNPMKVFKFERGIEK